MANVRSGFYPICYASILQTIARLRGIRRDTLDKKLGVIRERLGLENHHQLMGSLSALHAYNHAMLPGDQGKEGGVPLGKESR